MQNSKPPRAPGHSHLQDDDRRGLKRTGESDQVREEQSPLKRGVLGNLAFLLSTRVETCTFSVDVVLRTRNHEIWGCDLVTTEKGHGHSEPRMRLRDFLCSRTL